MVRPATSSCSGNPASLIRSGLAIQVRERAPERVLPCAAIRGGVGMFGSILRGATAVFLVGGLTSGVVAPGRALAEPERSLAHVEQRLTEIGPLERRSFALRAALPTKLWQVRTRLRRGDAVRTLLRDTQAATARA